jgi:hypothetical protein
MVAFAHADTEPPAPLPAAIGGVAVRRLGRHTCVVTPASDFLRLGAPAVEEAVGQAIECGCDDFVFDLARVRRWDTVGLRRMADLWRRLALLDCGVYVAVRDGGLTADLRRLPAQDAWTVYPAVVNALQALLARPA